MKTAWRDRYGGPEVVSVREVPRPVPVDDQVLVRVRAASVNRADLDFLRPRWRWARLLSGIRGPRRHTFGLDMAGEVEAIGPAVTRFGVGDRVFADMYLFGWNSFAEYVCAPERAFATVPEGTSLEDAACLPHSALLAVMSLKPTFGQTLHAGDSVLIVGASGNVGPFAVQIAKSMGLEVTGVCRTSKIDFVRSLGADHVIDYTTTDYTKTGPYDRVIDVDGHRSIFGYWKTVKRGGVYVAMGGTTGWILSFLLNALIRRFVRDGKHIGAMPGWRPFRADDVAVLQDLLLRKVLQPHIARRYPLADVQKAMRDVDEGTAEGKVLLVIG